MRTDKVALRGEAHAHQLLRRAGVATPQAAVLRIELVVVLARLGRPGADAALAAADLDHAVARRVERDLPVEAVAAQVDQLAAGVTVGLQRIQHLRRVVLGVGAGHHGLVVRQQRRALVVQFVVGDQVERMAHVGQPQQQVAVGRVVAQARAADVGVRIGDIAHPQIEHRPPPADQRDAGAVGVVVVGRQAVVAVLARVVGVGAPGLVLRHQGRAPGRVVHPFGPGVVAVDGVGVGRHQHRDLRGGLAFGRHDEERDVLLGGTGLQQQRVGIRLQALGQGHRMGGGPAAVVEVVVVEVDGAVVRGGMAEAVFLPRPAGAAHRTGGGVDQHAMVPVRPGVDHPLGVHVQREVPGAQAVLVVHGRHGRRPATGRQRPRQQHRLFQPAVEAVDGRGVAGAGQAQPA